MSFPQLGAALVGGLASSLFMPKPNIPSNIPVAPPAIVVPEQPTNAPTSPANAPLAPTTMSDTAALRRARANKAIEGGPSQLILSSRAQRQEQSTGASGTGGGLVTRTTLLGR